MTYQIQKDQIDLVYERMQALIIKVFHQNDEGKELLQLLLDDWCVNSSSYYEKMDALHLAYIEGRRDMLRLIKATITDHLKLIETQQKEAINVR